MVLTIKCSSKLNVQSKKELPLECNEALSVFIAEAPLLERFGSVVRLHSSFLVC